MASTFTANIGLNEPARGDLSGTWDTAANPNYTLLDSVVGAAATISGAAGSVVLGAGQFQSRMIIINSTLTASITLTFPTSFTKDYLIYNQCTGSSAFTVSMTTTSAVAAVICAPPGQATNVFNTGQSLIYLSFPPVGAYWDYAGSSVPNWVSGCLVPPYVNCDGTTISSATFPQLTTILGGTTLPDSRGLARYTLNQGTGRLTAGTGSVDGNTIFTVKSNPTTTLVTANLPPYTPSGSVTTTITSQFVQPTGAGSNPTNGSVWTAATPLAVSTFTGNAQGGVSQALNCVGTAYVGGLTLIRAA